MSIMDEIPTVIINMKPVTGSKKYYGVTSQKSRLGVMDQTLTITDFFAADYALTPIDCFFSRHKSATLLLYKLRLVVDKCSFDVVV